MQKVMKLLLFLLLIYSPQLMSAPTSYVGLTSEDRQALSRRGLLKNNLSLSEANRLIKEIFKLGRYERAELITIERNGQTHWEIRALPNRTIKEIQITGHNAFSRNEIMTLLDAPVGSVFIQQQLMMAIDRIKRQYEDQGYFNAKTDLNLEDTSDKGVLIKIDIVEGPVCKIGSISFIAPHTQITNLLLKKSKSYRRDSYTREHLIAIKDNLQEFLFQKQYFRASFLEPMQQFNEDKTQVDLTYEIENSYRFFIHLNISNQESASSILYKRQPPTKSDILKSLSLNATDGFGSLITLSQRIRNFYRSEGYPKVQVSASEQVLQESFEHHIFFNISPGHLFYIRQIEVTDMSRKYNQEYTDILRSNRSYFAKMAEVYVEDNILRDVRRLITTLQNQGYLKARMQSLTERFHDQEKEVTIRIAINEGQITRLRSLKFKGNEQITSKELLEVLKLEEGHGLNLSVLEEGFDALREHYLQKGFLDFRINNPNEVIKYYENDTQADIVFDLYEGPQVEVRNILIQGNEITKPEVILKELTFQPGYILTRNLIRDSQYRLQQTGLFSSVDITLPESGSSLKQRTVLIHVTERDPGFLRFILGVNNELGLTLRSIVGLGYRNLWGTARGINTRLELQYTDLSFLEHNVGMSYYEPFIFGSRTRGRIHIINSRKIISETQLEGENLIGSRTSLHLVLEREMSRKVILSYSLWKLELERRYGHLSKNNIESSVIGSTGPGIELDYRDDPFNTKKGIYSIFNLDFADPLLSPAMSNIRFISLFGGFNFYIPLFSNFVLANSIRGGYITNLNRGVSEIPESRVFLLGGQSSIRGYELNSIPNRSDLLDNFEDPLTILTDSYFYLLKSELRFPIFKALGGVLFYDGGGVKISQRHQRDEYRDAIGLGVRISTPVGPVSIEYGFRLKRRDESLGRLHFSIGAF